MAITRLDWSLEQLWAVCRDRLGQKFVRGCWISSSGETTGHPPIITQLFKHYHTHKTNQCLPWNTYWILLNSLHSLYTTIIIITNTNIALHLMQLDLLPFEVLTESPNNLQMYSPNEFSPSSSFIFDGSITWEQSKCDPLEPLEEHPSIEHREALINWQNNQPNHHHLFLYQY